MSNSNGSPGASRGPVPSWRMLSWTMALCAVAFVAWVIPVRDRCWDPQIIPHTRVAVSYEGGDCVLHLRSGAVTLARAECDRLQCEPGLLTTFQRVRPGLLADLVALYALGTLCWAARWRALLSFAGVELGVLDVWALTIEAQAGGVLLPGGLGGDAFRVAGILSRPVSPGRDETSTALVIATVLLDRAIGLAVMAGIAATMALASGGTTNRALVASLAAIPLAFLLGLGLLRAPGVTVDALPSARLRRLLAPVLAYVRHPRAAGAIVIATLLGVLNAAIQFAVIRGLVSAVGGAPTSEGWVYVGTAMAFIVAVVPALPGGWGTTDATFVFFFAFAGLSGGVTEAVCLLYRVLWYLSAVVGAIVNLTRTARTRRRQE